MQSKILKVVVGVAVGVVAGVAHAALPTEASGAFTTLSGNVTDILAAIWPIVASCTGGFVLIRLFKRGGNNVA